MMNCSLAARDLERDRIERTLEPLFNILFSLVHEGTVLFPRMLCWVQSASINQWNYSFCPFLIVQVIFSQVFKHKSFLYVYPVEISERDRDHHDKN
jgi:hypothetical protein